MVTEMDPQTEIGPEKTEGSEVPDHIQAGRQGDSPRAPLATCPP